MSSHDHGNDAGMSERIFLPKCQLHSCLPPSPLLQILLHQAEEVPYTSKVPTRISISKLVFRWILWTHAYSASAVACLHCLILLHQVRQLSKLTTQSSTLQAETDFPVHYRAISEDRVATIGRSCHEALLPGIWRLDLNMQVVFIVSMSKLISKLN